jgi:uncharacterized protein
MVVRTTPWHAGTPCWVDMSVTDLPAAQAFYGSVLGWTFLDTGEQFGHYTLCQKDGHNAAAMSGLMPGMTDPVPWTVYVASDDVAATAKLVTDNGGSFIAEPMEIPGNGTMAVALDPTGGAFGIWQAGGMVGFEIANEPGGVSWTDARLTDSDAGRAFYTAVFGYSYDALEGAGDYGTIAVEGVEGPVGGLGGMMGAPEGTPSHWLAYFSVADVDAAAELIEAGGGSVVRPAEDTPFGRIGMYADPTGVVFGLTSVAPPA